MAAVAEEVLIVDLDPQSNGSSGLGIERKARRASTYDVLTGAAPMREAVIATAVGLLLTVIPIGADVALLLAESVATATIECGPLDSLVESMTTMEGRVVRDAPMLMVSELDGKWEQGRPDGGTGGADGGWPRTAAAAAGVHPPSARDRGRPCPSASPPESNPAAARYSRTAAPRRSA